MIRLFRLTPVVLVLCFLVFLPVTLVTVSIAQDDMLDGFDEDFGDDFGDADTADESFPTLTDDMQKKSLLPFEAGGCLTLMSSANISHHAPEAGKPDWRGLSALRSELELTFEDKVADRLRWYVETKASHDFVYGLRDQDYTQELVDDRETQVELGEAYAAGRVNDYMDLSFGRQIVIWGKSDTIRVVDVINPLDLREPGLTDIEDRRLPVTMTKLDLYVKGWSLKSMAIHEIRFDRMPVWGSDYYPTASPLPPEHSPDSDWDNTEYAVSLSHSFNGGDFSFYYADMYNDTPHLETVPPGDPAVYSPYLDHGRMTMLGFDFNRAMGNLMLKTEMAVFDGVNYFNPAQVSGGTLVRGDCPEYTRYEGLLGFEYMGFHETVISFDASLKHIDGFDEVLEESPLAPQENVEQWVLRAARTFLNQTLELELLVSMYGWNGSDGAFERFLATYDMTDDLVITGGVVIYHEGESIPIETIGDNDRIFIQADYSF